jgi:hypothetical protein
MKFISFDQFVKILESQQVNEATSGEKDFGIFMKYTIAMVNLAKRKAKYPKLYQASKQLELDEMRDKAEVALESDDLVDKQTQTIKDKIKTAKEKLKTNSQLKPEQKTIEIQKLNDMEDEAIKKVKDNVTAAIQNEQSKIANQYSNAKTKVTREISELESKNSVSDVPTLQSEWDEFKANIDLKYNNKFLDDKFQLETQGDLDPEKLKKVQDRIKKQKKQLQDNAKERLSEIQQDKKDRETDLQNTINAAANDPDVKEAAESIMNFNKAFMKFTSLADSYTEDSSEEDLQKIKDAKKELNATKTKLSGSKFVKAKFVDNKDEGEELVASYKKQVDDAMDAYEDLKDKLGSAAAEELKAKRELVKKINTEIKELEASKTKNVPDNETDEDKKTRIEGIDNQIAAKRKEIEELEKVEGESDSSYKQKPWYRTNTGSLNESIAQKFARLLKG